MLNNLVMVGKIDSVPAKDGLDLVLEVRRSYLNMDGIFDSDFFKCRMWLGIRDNLIKYCKEGDVVAIKGRLESNYKKDNDTKINDVDIIIERLVFLRKNYSSNIECDKIKQE